MKWALFVLSISVSALAGSEIREKLSQLHDLRTQIRKAVFEKSRYKDELSRVQIEIEAQKERISALKLDQNQLKEKILQRVTALYKIHRLQPKGSVLQLLGSHSFLKKSFYVRYLNQQDRRLVEDFNQKSESLQKEQSQYERRLTFFQKVTAQNRKRHQELLAQEKKQREIISYVKNSIQIQEGTQRDPETFFSEKRGKLKLPSSGQIVNQFGVRRDRATDLSFIETGIYLRTEEGNPVTSVAAGEVLYLDQIPGWGLTLILDHGEFYYSVYAHLKDPSVRPGEKVLDNQRLAVVGPSSYDNKDSLYFEIRHFSEPQDPTEWIERGIL